MLGALQNILVFALTSVHIVLKPVRETLMGETLMGQIVRTVMKRQIYPGLNSVLEGNVDRTQQTRAALGNRG